MGPREAVPAVAAVPTVNRKQRKQNKPMEIKKCIYTIHLQKK